MMLRCKSITFENHQVTAPFAQTPPLELFHQIFLNLKIKCFVIQPALLVVKVVTNPLIAKPLNLKARFGDQKSHLPTTKDPMKLGYC